MLVSIYFFKNNTATRNLDKELGEKELGARCRAVAGYRRERGSSAAETQVEHEQRKKAGAGSVGFVMIRSLFVALLHDTYLWLCPVRGPFWCMPTATGWRDQRRSLCQ